MKTVATITMLATLTSAASAEPGSKNQIDVKARIAGTTEWLDNFDLAIFTGKLDLEVGVFYYRSSGYGLANSVHNIVTSNWETQDTVTLLDRPDSLLHPDGRQGNFNFGRRGQAQAAYTTGVDSGQLRIASTNNAADVPAGGISINQNTPIALGAAFDTRDAVLGFRFDMTLRNPDPGLVFGRNLVIDAPADRINSYSVYSDPTSLTPTSVMDSLLPTDGVAIHVVFYPFPSPSPLVMLALGGTLLTNRRR